MNDQLVFVFLLIVLVIFLLVKVEKHLGAGFKFGITLVKV
jgi:hypothetical protein